MTEGAPAASTASRGATPARRAMVRWAVRMLRREWRQQVLVILLLATAVAGAVGFGTAGYRLAPVPANAEFGTASHFLRFDEPPLAADVTAARNWFGTIDVIGHRAVSVAGRFEALDYRTQDPKGPYGAPMLALIEGRYPASGEVAVTDELAAEFDLIIGASLALDGTARTIVGMVENPSDLTDEFALLAPDDHAGPETITVLVASTEDRVLAFRPPDESNREISSRGATNEAVAVAVGILGLTTVVLVLVALLAAAGFMVVAQRRRRQLGMLAALGATERHLRLALVANGLALGAFAAVGGAAAGMVAWVAAHPWLESAVGFRFARFDLPWLLIGIVILLATGAATAAAWWPARMAAQVSTIRALSGRPERPRPVHRSAAVASVLVAAGLITLTVSGPVADQYAVHWINAGLVVGGTLATIAGILLVSPLAIRALDSQAASLPIAVRLALRNLARYQSRSGAALAALTVVIGIPAAIVITASAAQHSAEAGNLAENQLMIRASVYDGPFVPEPADLPDLQSAVAAIVADLENATTTDLEVAIDPTLDDGSGFDGRPASSLARRAEEGWADLSLLYVATPRLLSLHGLEQPDADTEILTTESGELAIIGGRPTGGEPKVPEALTGFQPLVPTYSSLPGTLITAQALVERSLESVPSGRWLIETSGPVTEDDIAQARDIAAGTDLTIEARDRQPGLIRARAIAAVAGVLLALGVLAATVGLIRNAAADDLRTLTATGATGGIRRTITATTAAALALLGAILGTAGAATILATGYLSITDALRRMPISYSVLLIVGTPVVAALGGWLLAGREPPAIARQPIE